MTKVATLFKTVRLEKGYELAEVSKKTKIPSKYLIAFEEEDSKNYPGEPYCSLSVKDYADFLGLNGQEILRLFRRDYIQKIENKNTIIANSGVTPKATFAIGIVIIIFFFAFYLINEYLKFTKAPDLHVNWPKIINSQSINVEGKTNPDATVRINQDLVIVNSDGTFSKKINTLTNPTKITVESKSPSGKVTIEEKTLNESVK